MSPVNTSDTALAPVQVSLALALGFGTGDLTGCLLPARARACCYRSEYGASLGPANSKPSPSTVHFHLPPPHLLPLPHRSPPAPTCSSSWAWPPGTWCE